MEWWRDARFGMFIPWGAYAVPAGTHKGERIPRIGEAAHRAGLRFGVYYSIMDWHHPDAQGSNYPDYNSRTWSNPHLGRYVDAYMKPQIRELLTQYPYIDVLWFDGEWIADWNDARGRDLYNYVRALRPSLIVNHRVGHPRQGLSGLNQEGHVDLGDFGTPEQQVPPEGLPGVDWETCMTMNDTWGFKSYDDDWKDTRTLLRTLIDVASKGGNFLLNVGPTADGVIPPPIVWRLREMGDWMKTNGEAIYGTAVSRSGMPAWGRYSAKRGRVYAHVFHWPKNGRLELTGVNEQPLRAYLLADGKPLTIPTSTSLP